MTKELILCQMASDPRVPREAMGYIADLQMEHCRSIEKDRLEQLERYIPDLVQEFRAVEDRK